MILPESTPLGDLSAGLIDENYRQLGCDAWSRDRFWRLCTALQRTPREMAAFLRIDYDQLRKRLLSGFTPQDGLILTIIEREATAIRSGQPPTRGIFLVTQLVEKSK